MSVRKLQYVLDGREPKPCPNVVDWSKWYGSADRKVAEDRDGDVVVSTIFTGLDSRHYGEGPPMLFETMTFFADRAILCDRYATWSEAEAGHQRWVKKALKPLETENP